MIGLCKNCNGCNRQEDETFEGVYRCDYATTKMTAKEIELEQKKIKLLASKGIKIK